MDLDAVARALRGFIFLAVPAYKSYCLFRLVSAESQEEELPTDLIARIQDMSAFWISLAFSVAIEYLLDQFLSWVPGYEVFKSAYYYWLGKHDSSCALLLYRVFICPLLQTYYLKAQKRITSPLGALDWMRAEVSRKVHQYAPASAAT